MKKLMIGMAFSILFLVTIVYAAQCSESWYCGEYGNCRFGKQTRDCYEIRGCGTEYNKPVTQRSCEGGSIISFGFLDSWDTGVLLIVLPIIAVVIVLIIIFYIVRKRSKPYKALDGQGEPDLIYDYVKEAMADGLSEKDIIDNLKDSGWSPNQVRNVIANLSQEKIKKYMPKNEVEMSIQKALNRGFSLDQIKRILMKKGWPEGKVEDLLEKFE